MIRKTLVAIAAVSTLTACAGGPASLGGEPPLTPTSRYVLQVEPDLDRIALAVHETGLSNSQHAALQALLGRFSAAQASEIVVEAPYGAAEPSARMAWQVRDVLQQTGASQVRVVSYVAPDATAPVLVGFQTVRAAVPQCGTAWGNLGRSGDNISASNFGCAVTANLAAQISDPRDIVAPRETTPADAGRRSVVLKDYRAGDVTSATPEPLVQRQAVSQAVQ